MKMQTDDEVTVALLVLGSRGGGVPVGSGPRPTQTNCHTCAHAREVPGNCHILCAKPCASVTGNKHGIERGWFMYPMLFDPTWRTNECANYEPTDAPVNAVSHAVSEAAQ